MTRSERTADLVVVGNGVIGLAVALACHDREPDLRIAVVGPSRRPGGATPAAAAMLAFASEARPRALVDPVEFAWLEFVAGSVRSWPSWLEGIADRAGLPESAVPRIASGVAIVGDAEDPEFDAIERAAERLGTPCAPIDPASLGLRDGSNDRRGLRLDEEGGVDPIEVLRLLESAARAASIEMIDDQVAGVEVSAVHLASRSTLHADRIVLASGAGAHDLLHEELRRRHAVPRVRHGIGVGLRGPVPPAIDDAGLVVRTPIRDDGTNLYVVPHGPGRGYIGATTVLADEPRAEPTAEEVEAITDAVDRLLGSGFVGGRHRTVIGSRPVSEDGRPIVGRLEEGLWIATGTGRHGLSAAPRLAAALAASILDDRSGPIRSVPSWSGRTVAL